MDDEDYDLIEDSDRIFLEEPMKASQYLLFGIVAFIVFFLLWAYFAKLDERTTAMGVVIPSTQVQDIQNLEGGIVSEILVKEGEIVKKGEVLLKIDDTRFKSEYQENLVTFNALQAKLIRLGAETNNQESLEFPETLANDYPEFVKNEEQLFKANRANYRATVDALTKNYELAKETYDLAKPLVEDGVISKIEFLKYQKEMNEAKGKIVIEEQGYLAKVNEEIVTAKSEVDGLSETLEGLKDRINRTTIKSPVDGIVKKINVDTIGAVIKPGDNIIEVVPVDDILQIEARVLPEKIAFISPGQEADVKFSAYDPAIYGSIKGTVKYLSADAIIEKNELGEDTSYYKIVIETEKNYLEFKGEKLPVIPGMQVTADILTGQKTVLQYIINPIIRAKQKALKER